MLSESSVDKRRTCPHFLERKSLTVYRTSYIL
jgi:hypothetical protein